MKELISLGFTYTLSHSISAQGTGKRMPLWLCWLILSALYSLIFTTIEFSGFPVSGIRGLATLAAQWGVVARGVVWTGRTECDQPPDYANVAFPVLVTVSTVLAYFRLSMNVSLTPDIIELGMVNDAATSADLVSMRLVVWMVTAFAVSAVCVWLRWKYVSRVHGPGWYACGCCRWLWPVCLKSTGFPIPCIRARAVFGDLFYQ